MPFSATHSRMNTRVVSLVLLQSSVSRYVLFLLIFSSFLTRMHYFKKI